jgi:DNA-3-methyladenine glycosylase
VAAEPVAATAPSAGAPLVRSFFARPAEIVAPELLGRVLVHDSPAGRVAVRLSEVEAYGLPGEDPPAHSYRGMTPRNAVMFGPPGHLYVYFTYGMHFCANLVCRPEGMGSGVLMRAGEVIEGGALALARRRGDTAGTAARTPTAAGRAIAHRDLARGPARLATALGLAREHNGLDCCDQGGAVMVLEGEPPPAASVRSGPRTGVSTGADTPWRFWIDGDATVSPYRPHAPRRRMTTGHTT